MTRLTRSTMLALACAALLAPAGGRAQGIGKSAPVPPEEITAALKRDADARIAAFSREYRLQREASAQRVRTVAATLAARFAKLDRARIRVDTTLAFIDTVLTAEGGADPGSIFIVLGSKLYPPGSPGVVRVTLQGRTLQATTIPGLSTPEHLEAIMPDFFGIAGPTPAQVEVMTSRGKSAPNTMIVKPELVQSQVNLYQLEDVLKAEPHGSNLGYHFSCLGGPPDCWHFHDASTLGVSHEAPTQSPPAAGTDQFLTSFKLKNNWVLRALIWHNPVSYGTPGRTSAKAAATLGTSSLATTVTWARDSSIANQAMYYLGYLIEGPRAMPYR